MTTISTEVSDEILQAIESYIQSQSDTPTFPAVVQTALHSFLTVQGYLSSYLDLNVKRSTL